MESRKMRRAFMSSIDMTETGRRLAQLLKDNGITTSELVECTGVTSQAVSKWRKGKALPSLDNLVRICMITGVDSIWDVLVVDMPEGADGMEDGADAEDSAGGHSFHAA